jgi:hypothetical protein
MIYIITNKLTGAEVYRYEADAPVEWHGMEFVTHDHTLQIAPPVETPVITPKKLTKLEYLRRFTAEERITIRTVAKTNVVLEDYLALLDLAEEVNTNDIDTIGAVTMLETAGLIAVGRAQEILHG